MTSQSIDETRQRLLSSSDDSNNSEREALLDSQGQGEFKRLQLAQQRLKQIVVDSEDDPLIDDESVAEDDSLLKHVDLDHQYEMAKSAHQGKLTELGEEKNKVIQEKKAQEKIARQKDQAKGIFTKTNLEPVLLTEVVKNYKTLLIYLENYQAIMQRQDVKSLMEAYDALKQRFETAKKEKLPDLLNAYLALKDFTLSHDFKNLKLQFETAKKHADNFMNIQIRYREFEMNKLAEKIEKEEDNSKQSTLKKQAANKIREDIKRSCVKFKTAHFNLDGKFSSNVNGAAKQRDLFDVFFSEMGISLAFNYFEVKGKPSNDLLLPIYKDNLFLKEVKKNESAAVEYLEKRIYSPIAFLAGKIINNTIIDDDYADIYRLQVDLLSIKVKKINKEILVREENFISLASEANSAFAMPINAEYFFDKLIALGKIKAQLKEQLENNDAQVLNDSLAIVQHDYFKEYASQPDSVSVLAVSREALAKQQAMKARQQALLATVIEEENKTLAGLDAFKEQLSSVYSDAYYVGRAKSFIKKIDQRLLTLYGMQYQGFLLTQKDYKLFIKNKEALKHEIDAIKVFARSLDKALVELIKHQDNIRLHYPDKTELLKELNQREVSFREIKNNLLEKQDRALSVYILAEKQESNLASFYLNDILLAFGELSIDDFFASVKTSVSLAYLRDEEVLSVCPAYQKTVSEKLRLINDLLARVDSLTELERLPLYKNQTITLEQQCKDLKNKLTTAKNKLTLIANNNTTEIIDVAKPKLTAPHFAALAERDRALIDCKALLIEKPRGVNLVNYANAFYQKDKRFLQEVFETLKGEQAKYVSGMTVEDLKTPDSVKQIEHALFSENLVAHINTDIVLAPNEDLSVIRLERWVQLLDLAWDEGNIDLAMSINTGIEQAIDKNKRLLESLPYLQRERLVYLNTELLKWHDGDYQLAEIKKNPAIIPFFPALLDVINRTEQNKRLEPNQAKKLDAELNAFLQLCLTRPHKIVSVPPSNEALDKELFPLKDFVNAADKRHLAIIGDALRQDRVLSISDAIDAWYNSVVAKSQLQNLASSDQPISSEMLKKIFQPMTTMSTQLSLAVSASLLAISSANARNDVLDTWLKILEILKKRGNTHAVDAILIAFKTAGLNHLAKNNLMLPDVLETISEANERYRKAQHQHARVSSQTPEYKRMKSCPSFRTLLASLEKLNGEKNLLNKQLAECQDREVTLTRALQKNEFSNCDLLNANYQAKMVEKWQAICVTIQSSIVSQRERFASLIEPSAEKMQLQAQLAQDEVQIMHYLSLLETLESTDFFSQARAETLLAICHFEQENLQQNLLKTEQRLQKNRAVLIEAQKEAVQATVTLPSLSSHFSALTTDFTVAQDTKFLNQAKKIVAVSSAPMKLNDSQKTSAFFTDGTLTNYRAHNAGQRYDAHKALIPNALLYDLIVKNDWVLKKQATVADYEALHTCLRANPTLPALREALAKIIESTIPNRDLIAVLKDNKQTVYRDLLENSVLKKCVADQVLKSSAFLRFFDRANYGTHAHVLALNKAIDTPLSDKDYKTLLTDVGIRLTPEQLTKVLAENIALRQAREVPARQAAEVALAAPTESRFNRWTNFAKAHPVQSTLTAAAACVLFKPALVVGGVMCAIEAFKPDSSNEQTNSGRVSKP